MARLSLLFADYPVRSLNYLVLVASALIFQSCSPKRVTPINYDWNSFSASTMEKLDAVTAEGAKEISLEELREVIENFSENTFNRQSIETTSNRNSVHKSFLVPPGMCAHLGYLYSLAGDKTNAKKYFELEKQLYPVSETFVERVQKELK